MNRHNKLVRGKIPDICRANGQSPSIRIIEGDGEYLKTLFDKDTEETDELREAIYEEAPETRRERILGELADKAEVFCAITEALGFTTAEVEAARLQKREERGGFEGRIFLEYTE